MWYVWYVGCAVVLCCKRAMWRGEMDGKRLINGPDCRVASKVCVEGET